jgi:hypothetical protein
MYDPIKEEKSFEETKKSELQRIEDAKKWEKEKGEGGTVGCINY